MLQSSEHLERAKHSGESFDALKCNKTRKWYYGIVCKSQVCTGREVPEPADRRLQTRRMPSWNAMDCFIRENLVLPVMYDSVQYVLVKQHGYIQWTNCTKNTLLGN